MPGLYSTDIMMLDAIFPLHRPASSGRATMRSFSIVRVLQMTAIVIPACAAVAAVMLCVPQWVAFGAALIGIVLFMTGKELHVGWCVIIGGVLMFGSVFAWAVRQ